MLSNQLVLSHTLDWLLVRNKLDLSHTLDKLGTNLSFPTCWIGEEPIGHFPHAGQVRNQLVLSHKLDRLGTKQFLSHTLDRLETTGYFNARWID
jgi:hypothetical protein